MYLPENSGDFAKSNRAHFSKTKIKPHQPASELGKRYVKYFWHPWSAIVAPATTFLAKPAWRTIDYYLQPSQLWAAHQNSNQLVGIRFASTTRYATIDLDAGGDYHNLPSVKRIKAALEDIGIVDIIPIQSSHSGGYHLIVTFEKELPTFNLACAIEQTLKDTGFQIRKGHLEIFPNVKQYSENGIINYNAIRCPMQPGSGALLLDDDLQAISDSVATFLDYCDRAAHRQDLTKLKNACKKARIRHNREQYRQKSGIKIEEWRNNWEEIIATGWTEPGQTNILLQIIVGYGIVFKDLQDENLVEYAIETAVEAPGYTKYCRHQHEIEARVRDWVECTTRHQWYTPYASYPKRPLGTFANTYALALVGGRGVKKSTDRDNVIPFEKPKSQNQERSEQAQKRIQSIVKVLEWDTGLKEGVTERGKQISAEHKRRFNKTLSQDTLYKHKHLWHPQRYIPDPWVENSIKAANNTLGNSINLGNSSQPENSANPYSEDYYGQFYQKSQFSKKQTARNPYPEDYYGQFTYMKVFCLPPAATAPQGLEAVEVIQQSEVCQKDSGVTQVVENRELINFANSVEIDLNQPSNQVEKSVSLNILQSNELNFNQDLLYPFDCGDSPKINNQNLSMLGDNGLAVVSTITALTPEPPQEILNQGGQSATVELPTVAPVTPELSPQSDNNGLQDASVGDSTSDDSSRIEELKRVTKLRLMAISHARRKVQQYGVIVGRIISGQERQRLEMIAKMQFYLDSGEKSLFEEATAWADANPGWFRPFAEDVLFRQRLD